MYNKITIYFTLGADFPSGGNYEITVTTPHAGSIPAGSIATNLPVASGKSLSCK